MKLLFTSLFAVSFIFSLAQTPADGYHMDEINGMTISTCEAAFFDSGGFAENC